MSADGFHAAESMPLRAGPLSYFDPMPSREGKQVYALVPSCEN
jgi:hypothetical protein